MQCKVEARKNFNPPKLMSTSLYKNSNASNMDTNQSKCECYLFQTANSCAKLKELLMPNNCKIVFVLPRNGWVWFSQLPHSTMAKIKYSSKVTKTQAQALPINTICLPNPCIHQQDRVREKAKMITAHNPKPKAKVKLLIKAKEKVKATMPINELLLQVIPQVMAKGREE